MRTDLALILLWKRAVLRRRDRWSREKLLRFQAERLAQLRAYAVERSPFYRRFHAGLEHAPLSELPVLTKSQLMHGFDDVVTDRRIKLKAVEDHIAHSHPGSRFRHRYWICTTSGTTGRHGIFLYGLNEWATVLASLVRVNDWAGLPGGPPHRVRIGVVGSLSPWHQSCAVSSSLSDFWVPVVRTSPAEPLSQISDRLSTLRPDVLITLAGMAAQLVEEQRAGRLLIAPKALVSVAELLTPATRRMMRDTWNVEPYDLYATSETAGLAAECAYHSGLHLFEDLVIPEVVDKNNRPVPPGTPGEKLLVTVLFSRTMPLIRYELDDSITLTTGLCPCGRPFQRISRVEGRAADTLRFERSDGSQAVLHPVRFGSIFDMLELKGWQVVKEPDRLRVLLLAPVTPDGQNVVKERVEHLLRDLGLEALVVAVDVVTELPRSASGKTILVRDATASVARDAPTAAPAQA